MGYGQTSSPTVQFERPTGRVGNEFDSCNASRMNPSTTKTASSMMCSAAVCKMKRSMRIHKNQYLVFKLLKSELIKKEITFNTTMKSSAEQNNASAVAVPIGSAPSIPMFQQTKQGGKCCGCCCDYRRAVIILAIIAIVFGVIGLVAGQREPQTGNSDLDNQIENIQSQYATADLVLNVVGLVMAIVSILGAVLFNIYMIAANVLYVCIQFILTVVFGSRMLNETLILLDEENYGGDGAYTESEEDAAEGIIKASAVAVYVIAGIITAFWIYPSVMLIKEIKTGIMTRETYPREEHSCCCTASK